VTTEGKQELLCAVLNGVIFNHLEWPLCTSNRPIFYTLWHLSYLHKWWR